MCAIGMPRDSGRERESREGDDFQFYSTNVNGRVPSGNFGSNWLSDHRLRKQMSVDFVARVVEALSVEIRGEMAKFLIRKCRARGRTHTRREREGPRCARYRDLFETAKRTMINKNVTRKLRTAAVRSEVTRERNEIAGVPDIRH